LIVPAKGFSLVLQALFGLQQLTTVQQAKSGTVIAL